MNKKTLASKATLSGIGLHTGSDISITLLPSDTAGYKFKRIDIVPEVIIQGDANHVSNTNRSTTLSAGDVSISTVEHLLSALHGMGVDQAIIEVNGPEIPILDGSSKLFVDAIKKAGIKELDEEKDYLIIDEPIFLKDENGSEIIAVPADNFEASVIIDFHGSQISEQSASIEDLKNYELELSACRTFVFTNELRFLYDNGLIKGGDLNNAIVIAEPGLTQSSLDQLSEKFNLPKRQMSADGIINDNKLHFPNELARHKLLDLIGDLSLVGKPIKGKIIAVKPGHKINTDFAKLLKKKLNEQKKLKGKPHYDPDVPPIMDLVKIKSFLPHRYPFLLVDKIIELNQSFVVGVKNITFNESLFQGHFPDNPIFPGVLQMEALAQTGGILALSTVEVPDKWDTYFLKMENVKFKNKVVPGDTLILKMELLSPIRRGIVHMQGTAYVGNKIVSEGELTAQIIKRPD